MSHVVFLTPPTTGHTNPVLPLVEELRSRGHRVSFATGPATSSAVRGAGARAIELPLEVHDATAGDEGFSTRALAGTLNRLVDDVRTVAPALVAALEADRPDLICYDDLFFVGPLLGGRFSVPSVKLVPHFADNEHFSLAAHMVPHGFDLAEPFMAAFAENVMRLAGEWMPASAPAAPGTPDPSLVFIPQWFQYEGESFGKNVSFLGPCALPGGTDGGWRPSGRVDPLVYISLGTVMTDRPEFFKLCMEAFGDGPWQVAMSTGRHVGAEVLPPAPSNFEIRPFFPQREVLGYAQAFVTHAGMNSVMEALSDRVPMVMVPQTMEGAVNARRVEELGFGRVLDRGTVTAENLSEAVRQVAGDLRIRHALARAAAGLHTGGGAAAGADVIERLLAGPHDD